ncbi:MAG: hypothetical protein GY901_10260 [Actinomycetia bacterium]|jgi:hypothetical protein|nr:hypothetical protein [Actinomycetes bacterium]
MPTSYELIQGAAALCDGPTFDEETGEVSEEAWASWQDTVDAWASDSGDKLLAIEAVLTRMGAEQKLHKEQARMHAAQAKAIEARAVRVKDLAGAVLTAYKAVRGEGKVRMSDGRSVWLAKSVKTVVTDEGILPAECWVTTKKVSLKQVKQWLTGESADSLQGAHLETSHTPRWGKPRGSK